MDSFDPTDLQSSGLQTLNAPSVASIDERAASVAPSFQPRPVAQPAIAPVRAAPVQAPAQRIQQAPVRTPPPAAPPINFQSFNPLNVPQAQAQAPHQTQPIQDGPEPPGFTLSKATVQSWLDHGVTPQAAHQTAIALDSSYAMGDARMQAYNKTQGASWNANYPAWSLHDAYGAGTAPPKQDAVTNKLIALNDSPPGHQYSPEVQSVLDSLNNGPPQNNGGPDFMASSDQSALQDVKNIGQAWDDYKSGRQNDVQTTLKMASYAVSGLLQPVTHATQPIWNLASAVTGGLEDAAQAVGKYLGDSSVGQSLKAAITNTLAPAHEAAMQSLGSLITAAKAHTSAPTVETAKAVAQAIQDSLNAYGAFEGVSKGLDTAKARVNSNTEIPLPKVMTDAARAVKDAPGNIMNKFRDIDPAAEAAKTEANAQYRAEISKPKTAEDISVPARTLANDLEASKNKTAIIQDGKVIGYKPNADVAATIKGNVTDPNNIPQSLGEIQDAKGKLSDQARAELTKQTAGQIGEFKTQRYQNAAVKDLRGVLTNTIENEDNQVHLVGDGDTPQKVASLLESKYQKLLSQSGEKEVAKLDLRQWLDKKIGGKNFGKDISELTPNVRSMVLFRRALSDSLETNAKAIGGQYQSIMDQVHNLYGAEDTVGSHLAKPETIEQRFTVPGEQKLPNEMELTNKEYVKGVGKSLGKAVLKATPLAAAIDLLKHAP